MEIPGKDSLSLGIPRKETPLSETSTTGLFFSGNRLALLAQWFNDIRAGKCQARLFLLLGK